MTEPRPSGWTRPLVLLTACAVLAGLLTGCGSAAGRPVVAARAGAVPDAPLAAGTGRVPVGALFVAPRGRDSAAGTMRAPLATLRAAVHRARPGQAIVLRGGTYRQSVGTVRTRISVSAFPGERVWFKGSDVVTGWRRVGAIWERTGWNPPLCRDCHLPNIIDPAHPLAGRPDMVFADGAPLREVATRAEVRPGRFFVDTAAHALFVGTDPATATIEASTRDILMQLDGAAAGSVLRGIGVAQYGANQEYGHHGAMLVVNAPRVRLLENTFAYSASTGALVVKPDAVLRGNLFVHNGLAGLVANLADRIRLVRNEFRANNAEHFATTGDAVGAAGAKITHTRRPYVVHNRFLGNAAAGWWCDLGCTDAAVVGNLARDNSGDGLYYEVSSRALIVSNALIGNSRGLKVSSSDGVRIYHNSFAGNGVAVGLYNDPRAVGYDPYSAQLGLSWRTERTELVNNLYAVRSNAGPLIESGDPVGKAVGSYVTRSDGNGYLSVGPRPVRPLATWLLADTVRPFGTLAELRAATGTDTRSLAATIPAGPLTGAFLLTATAPGARAGVPTPRDVAAAAGVPARVHPDIGVLGPPG